MNLFKSGRGSHWYSQDGNPHHEVEMKTKPGEFRPTTVGDARKLNLLPSVTNVLGVVAKPELDAWKQSQAVLAALTLPRIDGESDDDFADRVVRDATQQVKDAALRGVKIHHAVESWLTMRRVDVCVSVERLFTPFIEWSDKNILNVLSAEQTVIGDGYAGRYDVYAELRGIGLAIVDIKSRKRGANGKFMLYDADDMQLAAYQAPFGNRPRRVSILIDSNEPSEPFMHVWPAEKDDAAYKAFLGAFEAWKYIKNYYPS